MPPFPARAVFALLVVVSAGSAQSTSTLVPFATTPDIPAASRTSGFTILFEQGDRTYLPLQFAISPPFGLLSSQDSLNQLLGSGTNLFSTLPAGPPNVAPGSQIVAIGDLAGNGSVGLAYLNTARSTPAVTVYSFSPSFGYLGAASYHVGDYPSGVISTDLNADGKTDLAVGFSGGVAVFLNKGDGTFGTATVYAQPNVGAIAAADVNHDGKVDIIGTSTPSSASGTAATSLFVLPGTGGGAFGAAITSPVPSLVRGLTVGDVNGDGNLDVVLAAGGSCFVLLGQGSGAFTAGPTLSSGLNFSYVAAGDLNGDGKLDLALVEPATNSVYVAIGKGDGTFQLESGYATSYSPSAAILTDYNHDGKLDILIGLGDARAIGANLNSDTIDVLLGRGDGSFEGAPVQQKATTHSDSPESGFALAADFNGDGYVDAVSGGIFGTGASIFYGTGAGFQPPISILTASTNISGGAAGDFNGDGRTDLALSTGVGGSVSILLSSSSGFGAPTSTSSGGTTPGAIASADFNGDGKADLAVLNAGDPFDSTAPVSLAILSGNGTGSFSVANTYPITVTPNAIVAVDLNGDAKPDLVVTESAGLGPSEPGGVAVYMNAGTAAFAAPSLLTPIPHPTRAEVGDVNLDGRPDVVIVGTDNDGNDLLAILLGRGDGTFQSPVLISTDFGPADVAIHDFDGDSKPDLVVSHCCAKTDMTFMKGNGDGSFQPEIHFSGGASPSYLVMADENNDHKTDLIVGGAYSNVTLLLDNSVALATTVNAASFAPDQTVSPDSIASVFGVDLATQTAVAAQLSASVAGTSVTVADASGVSQSALLFFVSPGQVNFAVPPGLISGAGTVTVTSGDGTVTRGPVTIATTAPGLFVAGNLALGSIARADAQGHQTSQLLVTANASGSAVTTPISLDPSTDQVYLVLYGTGMRGAQLSDVTVQVGNTTIHPVFAGATPQFTGEDQINFQLPYSLKGSGDTAITVTAGATSNAAHITIQ